MVVIGGLGFSRDDATAVPDISLLLQGSRCRQSRQFLPGGKVGP